MTMALRRCSLVFTVLLLFITAGLIRTNPPVSGRAPEQLAGIHDGIQGETISAGSVSPWEIARVVSESNKKWKESRISQEVDFDLTWRKLEIPPGPFELCVGDCNAETYKLELDGQPGEEVLLKLTRSVNFCRFLIFTAVRGGSQDKTQWIFRGYVDHDFNRYQMARHRVVMFEGRPWLVIRGQEGSGSGYSLYGETWYEVGPNALRAVLSYPIEGHTYPWPTGLGRDFRAHVPKRNRKHLIISYEVSYTVLSGERQKLSKFFVNRHHACYTWDQRNHAFAFSAVCSDISQQEIAAIANIESEEEESEQPQQIGSTTFYSADQTRAFVGGGYEVFLKYNFPGLMKISKDKSNPMREWLRRFLAECHDTAEKRELLVALGKE